MPDSYDTDTPADVFVKEYANEIEDKVILATGFFPDGFGTFFLGQVAKARPKLLVLAGRTRTKNRATADALAKSDPKVTTRTLTLDLESLRQILKVAEEVNVWDDVPLINVLINNNRIMPCPYAKP